MLRFRRRSSDDAVTEDETSPPVEEGEHLADEQLANEHLADERVDDERLDDRGAVAEDVAPDRLSELEGIEASEDRATLEDQSPVVAEATDEEEVSEGRRSLKSRLGRNVAAPFRALRRRGRIDDELLADLEEVLLMADVGLATTTRLLDGLREQARSKDAPEPIDALRSVAASLFEGDDPTLVVGERPSVWLFVGVNGVGKTTTIGKLAKREAEAGRTVVAAAGDTFRAAAVEQLEIWAERAGVEIVGGGEGADPASVVYDAIQHAAARGADLVLADTAGRLHTKANLMAELEKVRRIADRPPGHVTEVLLVIDATTGQNGLAQARQFAEVAGVTGIVLTKLDGSAKGGIVLAIRSELGLPIKLVGLGEGPDDLVAFDAEEFVAALLD